MKLANPGQDVIQSATNGDLAAIDTLLVTIQPGIFNLAVRMLGNREDAADSTQEILLKVVTHLGGFRGESAFTTWVFQIARNHLLTASTRSREHPEISLESIEEHLGAGLRFAATLDDPHGMEHSLTPEDKLEARQIALSCTQNMLMALNREQRLAYLLDIVFGLSSDDAANVLGIKAATYRQRLARARTILEEFVRCSCGLANPEAACQCERQLPGIRHIQSAEPNSKSVSLIATSRGEQEESERNFNTLVRMSDAAALFRSHPTYRAPDSMISAVRAVLRIEGYWSDGSIH